jgi:hypothetical protein
MMLISAIAAGTILWLAVRGVPQPRQVSAAEPTVIRFEPRAARHVRLVIQRTSALEPCIDELEVYAVGNSRNLALAEAGSVAAASSCLTGYASHRIAHLNDGRYGNARSWIAASATAGEWAQITLPNVAQVERVVFSRDRRGEYADRVPLWVDVLTSLDGESWSKAAELRGELAASSGGSAVRSIPFRQEHARLVRLTILGTDNGAPPAIAELRVFGKEPETDLAAPAQGASVAASSSEESASALNDGSVATCWNASEPDRQWVQVRLADRIEVNRFEITRSPSADAGFPSVFSVDISVDGRRWKTVAREGWPVMPPPPPIGTIEPAVAQPSRLHSEPPAALTVPDRDACGYRNLALSARAKASASGVIPGYPELHTIAHLNDGQYGNSHSWVADTTPAWAEIDLGASYWVYRVAFGSDRTGRFRDRTPTQWKVLASMGSASQPSWKPVAAGQGSRDATVRVEHVFRPVLARRIRVLIEAARDGSCRLDELEVYGSPDPIPIQRIGKFDEWPSGSDDALDAVHRAFFFEEYAWLKTFGRADLDPALTEYVRVWKYPDHHGDDDLPLPAVAEPPALDGRLTDACWQASSRGTVRVASLDDEHAGPLVEQRVSACAYGDSYYLALEWDRLLSMHLAVVSAGDWSGCGALALAPDGVKLIRYRTEPGGALVTASTTALDARVDLKARQAEIRLPRVLFPAARTYGLRVGLGLGGRHTSHLGRPVAFRAGDVGVAQASAYANGSFAVRLAAAERPVAIELAHDGRTEMTVKLNSRDTRVISVPAQLGPLGPESDVQLTDAAGHRWKLHLFAYDPLRRALALAGPLLDRLTAQGVRVTAQREALERIRKDAASIGIGDPARRVLYMKARTIKRLLTLCAPELASLRRILCVRRHPYEPSHNYSDLFDATGAMGGSVGIVEIPHDGIALRPENARFRTLFDAGKGIARDPSAAFDLSRVYFAWKPTSDGYFRLMSVRPDGSGLKQLTDGPFHDVYPTPLPDGGLAFVSTRCRARYLCWRPQAYVLFRKDAGRIQPLSFANLSEWAPSITRDGLILWTRSEYQDKGADFSHTLWTIRPDGTHADLVFGNTLIQPNGYVGAHEVPGTNEIICTLISHFGDLNGPLALIDRSRGRFDPAAIQCLTPEVPWPGVWPAEECFRDPVPVSRDFFLCSHAPARKFDIYLLDRYGNRELIYADLSISTMGPVPFVRRPLPAAIARAAAHGPASSGATTAWGEFIVSDVYAGLGPSVPKGSVKWIRVSQEVRAELDRVGRGYRTDHPDFMDWYATPVHLVNGPYGWPSFVAKASWGLVPVASDGSARFRAPAGKMLYFSVLDRDFNEIQRMRSIVQLSPGERRGCIGCHEPRQQAPAAGYRPTLSPSAIRTYAWDGRPFSFERDVQPALDRHCVRCHGGGDPRGIDLRNERDEDLVPRAYRTLISQGLVHYFDWSYNPGGNEKADPMTFGSRRSKLWTVLGSGHHGVRMSEEDTLRLKTWIDLNCPLWPDYVHRPERAAARP